MIKYMIPITLIGTVILSIPFGVNNSIIVPSNDVTNATSKILVILISLNINIIIDVIINDTKNIVSDPTTVLLLIRTLLLNVLPNQAAKPSP